MTELGSGPPGLAGLTEIMELLFPAPARVRQLRRPSLRTEPHTYLVLPTLRRPRLLLPSDSALAAASLRYARHPRSLRARVLTFAACTLLRLGGGRLLPARVRIADCGEGDSMVRMLEGVFGHPVSLGIFLGPPRANRKPVLQVLDPDGRLVGIAKIGINPLTRELSVAEGHALDELGDRRLQTLVSPRLVFQGEWRGLSVLVQSPLPIWTLASTPADEVRDRAMRELAESGGAVHERLAGGRFSRQLREDLDQVETTELTVLARRALDAIDAEPQAPVVSFGSWHGDWTSWNMAQTPTHAVVWDWERFADGVPVGFDALHYAFQPGLKVSSGRPGRGLALVERAPAILRPYDVEDGPARTIALCYLIHIGTRYLVDRQSETGVGGGVVEEWLLPALERFLAPAGRQEVSGRG